MTGRARSFRRVIATAALCLGHAGAGFAQDAFGRAVAVTGDQIAVVKPGTSRGAAGIRIFRRDARGEWQPGEWLEPIDARPGEGLGSSVAMVGNTMLVAAADADASWGAHVYRFDGSTWQASGRIALRRGARAQASAPDFATMMRFAQPPGRLVALAPDGSLAAIAEVEAGRVALARPAPGGTGWVVEARIRPDSVRRVAVVSLAVSPDRLAVGLAEPDRPGRVLVFARASAGAWAPLASLRPPPDSPPDPAFGSALAFDRDAVLVGSAGAATVMEYPAPHPGDNLPATILRPRAEPGGARPTQTGLTAAAPTGNGAEGNGFGAALAVDAAALWIGAPLADGGSGAIYRFRRSGTDWLPAGQESASPLEPRSAFGSALALGSGVAVTGAPNARGGYGIARVWTRTADGALSTPIDLRAGDELEAVAGGEVRCDGGAAGRFECQNVDLAAFLPIQAIGGEPGEHVSDLWGWTDPATAREYALVGRVGGVAIVDVTDAANPRYLGVVPGNPSGARDIKVYRNTMFVTGDGAGAHGLLIFDLTRLRNASGPPVRFDPDARYDGIASAHNLVMDTATATAIPVSVSAGGTTCGGGLHMIDIHDPMHPVFAGCYTDTEGLIWKGRTHDAQCTIYHGPDEKYRGRDLCFVSNETALRIVDITDRTRPEPVSVASYPDRGYVHQGWLTGDQRWFYMNDEADELVGLTARTRTLIWDVADLDDPVLAGQYFGPDAATDHNLYIRGNLMYQANYQAGLRVVDISDPLHPVEVGHFDTTPWNGNPPGWVGGAWTAFPYLRSGTILVSSINEGLFLLRYRRRPVS